MPIDPAIGGTIKLSASQSARPDTAQPDDRVFDSLLAGTLNKQGFGVQACPASQPALLRSLPCFAACPASQSEARERGQGARPGSEAREQGQGEAGVVKDSSDSDHRTLELENSLQLAAGLPHPLPLARPALRSEAGDGGGQGGGDFSFHPPLFLLPSREGKFGYLAACCGDVHSSNPVLQSFLEVKSHGADAIKHYSVTPPQTLEAGVKFPHIPLFQKGTEIPPLRPYSELPGFVQQSGAGQTPYAITISASETQSPHAPFNKGGQGGILNANLIKSEVATGFSLRDELSALSESIRGGQVTNKEQNKGLSLTEVSMKPENIFFHVDNRNNADGSTWAERVTEPSEGIHIRENTFVITKKDGTAIEISLEPDGIGKLDIEISLDRGVINAQINASETIGKELIERNLYNILNALIKDGLNIGGFSVSLRDKRNEMKGDVRERDLRGNELTKNIQLPIAYSSKGIISIFV